MNDSRRQFLKQSAAAASVVPYFLSSQPAFANASANDRPRMACIGVGSQGMHDSGQHARFADIVAVCDVDANHAERARVAENIGRGKAKAYSDYRKVLDRSDVDVVSIVTPDHWHVKIAIEALEAGKHVFCQKPLTLTLEENQLVRAAAKRHPDRVFFIGTQQRADSRRFLRAVNMVQKGLLGAIKKVTIGIDGSPTGGPFPVEEVPKELDWEMWLGQAPLVDYRARRCHYEFRWWYEYSGGKFTDWGAHHIDIASWAIGQTSEGQGPVEIDGSSAKHPVEFVDGMPAVDDSYNTSHDFSVKCRFENGIEFDVTSRERNGILFEGSRGRLFVNREKITGVPVEEDWDAGMYGREELTELYKGKPHEGHWENFYRTLREGGLPVSDLYSHLQVMNTCHLCAIASRLGRKITWDPKSERIVGDDTAAGLASREQRKGYEVPRV
ncbi:Gfo/Idh/MocA family protein [Botrimarina mediterranea]|uniref:Inositol 2-dehydrogenase n=1 Tax=Botrimarina mediterranea TaxID=2528022 RepID=A0A518K9N3_9BACT|nr:Gfo/Idh/MocA family oxidoreductase [Botrimarina mediterranea]QDV74504.1 Inositol 2-dehydrogenase [Botrimarina mediterranea]QDV79144.1 Inositol 2-dehydrogenase [Planctomycetes bacterium K2D]